MISPSAQATIREATDMLRVHDGEDSRLDALVAELESLGDGAEAGRDQDAVLDELVKAQALPESEAARRARRRAQRRYLHSVIPAASDALGDAA
jgi:hypothetical protein